MNKLILFIGLFVLMPLTFASQTFYPKLPQCSPTTSLFQFCKTLYFYMPQFFNKLEYQVNIINTSTYLTGGQGALQEYQAELNVEALAFQNRSLSASVFNNVSTGVATDINSTLSGEVSTVGSQIGLTSSNTVLCSSCKAQNQNLSQTDNIIIADTAIVDTEIRNIDVAVVTQSNQQNQQCASGSLNACIAVAGGLNGNGNTQVTVGVVADVPLIAPMLPIQDQTVTAPTATPAIEASIVQSDTVSTSIMTTPVSAPPVVSVSNGDAPSGTTGMVSVSAGVGI